MRTRETRRETYVMQVRVGDRFYDFLQCSTLEKLMQRYERVIRQKQEDSILKNGTNWQWQWSKCCTAARATIDELKDHRIRHIVETTVITREVDEWI